jgi:DNA-binding transcriptional ArsR family regulator/uncharacterized protein YndB with AHSA1/START domain
MLTDDGTSPIWRVLADPTRRALLDLLRDRPRTTGELAASFPTSRFAVMKHLGVLEEAGLIVVSRRGRERWNSLNAVPLRAAYERWMSPYAEQWATSLLRLRDAVHTKEERMTVDLNNASVATGSIDVTNEIRIEAPREKVFDALCAVGEWWPHRFRDGSTVGFEPTIGGRFYEDWGNGDGALYGVVGTIARPEKLSVTGPMGMTGPVTSVFTYELTEDGDATVLRCTHKAFGDISPETVEGYTHGWPAVNDALLAYLGAA